MAYHEDIEDYLDELGEHHSALVRSVLEIAYQALPDLELKLAVGWGTINLAAPKFAGCIAATKAGAKVYFNWGPFLDDPAGYIDIQGKRTAQKIINSAADIDRKAITGLLRQASELANDT